VAFALKAQKDPHSISDEDLELLKKLDVTDMEIVEVLEVMTLCDGINRFCDALDIGNDAWLID
jgi:alkylhydroperoxidase family enzyme